MGTPLAKTVLILYMLVTTMEKLEDVLRNVSPGKIEGTCFSHHFVSIACLSANVMNPVCAIHFVYIYPACIECCSRNAVQKFRYFDCCKVL